MQNKLHPPSGQKWDAENLLRLAEVMANMPVLASVCVSAGLAICINNIGICDTYQKSSQA